MHNSSIACGLDIIHPCSTKMEFYPNGFNHFDIAFVGVRLLVRFLIAWSSDVAVIWYSVIDIT